MYRRENLKALPEHMRIGVQEYIEDGNPIGDFLTAIFSNKLVESFLRADEINLAYMREWVQFLYWTVPAGARGSEANVRWWQEIGGLNGLTAAKGETDA